MAASHHITPAKKEESKLKHLPLNNPEIIKSLTLFRNIVASCYGPMGKLKVIQNQSGGHVTVTSNANRLLQVLSVKSPVLKLLITAVQGHIQSYSDGGLRTSIFALDLILLSLDTDTHPRLVGDLYHEILQIAVNYLMSSECQCGVTHDVMNLNLLLCLAKSLFSSKSLCGLSRSSLEHVAYLVVRSFLSCSDETETMTFTLPFMIAIEGNSPMNSYISPGIIIEAPEIPTFHTKPLNITRSNEDGHIGQIKVIMVTTSMAGDSSLLSGVGLHVSDGRALPDAVVLQMQQWANKVADLGVGVVLCQKVVHPKIKQVWRRRAVFVVDRLGIQYISLLQQLTGAACFTSFLSPPVNDMCGWIDDAVHEVISGRSYLHLTRSGSSVNTLVLCHTSEEHVAELKSVCEVALACLQRAVLNPFIFAGGGCWQTNLLVFMRRKISLDAATMAERLGCSKTNVLSVTTVFINCLIRLVQALDPAADHYVDRVYHHHWTNTCTVCECGMISRQDTEDKFDLLYCTPAGFTDSGLLAQTCDDNNIQSGALSDCSVIDLGAVVINSLQVAVSIAAVILGTGGIIQQ